MLAVQHLEQDVAERKDIAAYGQLVAGDLLRAHVEDRPLNCARTRRATLGSVNDLRIPEIEHFDVIVCGNEDVLRLQIAMYGAILMGHLDRVRKLYGERASLFYGQALVLAQHLPKRPTLQQLHY